MTYQLGRDVWLWIDPARYCNISCKLCYTRPSHARQYLKLADLDFYIEKLKTADLKIQEITLNWRGEPLTNRDFPQIVYRVLTAFPKTRVQFHTNAMLLSDRVCDELCAIGAPFHVYLSIDGGNEKSHETNRGANTFKSAISGGLNLLQRRGGGSWPSVCLYQLDLGVTLADYDPIFLRLAERCDTWQRVRPIVRSGLEASFLDVERNASGVNAEELWIASVGGLQPRGSCFWAGYSLSIAPTGSVSICILNQVSNQDGVLGNLKSDSVEEVLSRASNFRRQLEAEGRASVSHCAKCFKVEGEPRRPRATIDLRPGIREGL